MKVVIDIPENDYKLACNYPDALIACYAHYIKAGVPLPKKHGRLVDADELKTAFPRCDNNMDIKIASVRATVNHMPTIIEAEGDE